VRPVGVRALRGIGPVWWKRQARPHPYGAHSNGWARRPKGMALGLAAYAPSGAFWRFRRLENISIVARPAK